MKRLTLTFDNGPCPKTTPRVLDLLAERQIKSTFFVCGNRIGTDRARAILKRTVREGHWLGNHTFSHSKPLGFSNEASVAEREIGHTQDLLGDLVSGERLFRPYGGGGRIGPHLLSRPALTFLIQGGYTCVLWNSVPRDWEDPTGWPQRALQSIRDREWTLMVLHDLPTGAMDQLPSFLDRVQEENVEIVQDFPQGWVPIQRGAIRGDIDRIVASG